MRDDFNAPGGPGLVNARPTIEFNIDEFRDVLGDVELPEDQAIELLKALWSIMCTFVELGFTVDICAHLESELQIAAHANTEELESI